MNSCMRQTPIPDQMHHSFLRDKQAWENAIAMYQGPDPLDHWYNYVCWYENHGHGDPENKFRETLERCLTIFEHSDYYKQDTRLVRLWIKYIDMQAHPLHFYQVLYQRGVGRQVAAFYISWAGYYESIHALKEAESVYSLGFQEKAQSYAELHHAHSKLMYIRQTTPKPPTTVAAAVPQQQQPIPEQQQQPQLQQHPAQQQQQHQVHFHHPQPQQQPMPSPTQQQQVQTPQMQMHTSPQQQQQQQIYQRVAFSQQQQQHLQQQLHMPVQQQQLPLQQQHLYQAHNYQQQQQINHAHQNHQAQQQPLHVNNEQVVVVAAPGVNYIHQQGIDASQSNNINVPIEQELPATTTSVQHYEKSLPAAETAKVAPSPQIDGIRLPRKFATYCHNNYETWKPALFLEEPTDPSRHCHYAKDVVYPGTSIEYSPEELRARKYSVLLEKLKQEREKNTSQAVMANEAVQLQQLEEIGTIQQLEQQQQQLQHQQLQQNHYYEQQTQNVNVGNENKGHEQQKHNSSYAENDGDEDYDEEDGEEEDAEEEEEEDEDDNYPQETLQQQQNHQSSSMVNTIGDLEEQIEASTIRFTMNSATVQQQQGGSSCSSNANKTIKIKFKKERQHGSHSLKGSNYSAYTVESIYQQEVLSPIAGGGQERRNGHSFHPYNLGQTSTPKASTKRNKKLKNVNKFQIGGGTGGGGSSSSSSSADLAATNNGRTIAADAHRNDNTINNATFNDNANYSFSSAAALDNSNCSLTSAVGRLNFRDVSGVVGGNNTSTNIADFSTYQENSYFATQHDAEAKERRLHKALETIERHMAKEAIDPFSSELCRAFLTKLTFPGTDDAHANYKIIQTPLPKIANTRTLTLPDGVHFNIDKEVGRGSYGSVYKATDAKTGAVVALKYQKPPNTWEIYICDQVLKRIQSPNILPGLMDVSTAIIAPNASLIATEFSPFGSLLDINNKIRQATTKVMHESLVMHFSSQICNIINHLHHNKIIHADIKPDNFLLMRIPSTDLHFPSLRLIDFGCAIDMTLFPDVDKTKFRKVIQTDGFTCIEMQEGRPWSYETDLFCIAGTVHVMLLGEYMQLQKRAGSWDIKQKLPRYLKKHVWTKFFSGMLNIKTTSKLPDLGELRCIFEEEAAKMDSELQNQIRTLKNILYRR